MKKWALLLLFLPALVLGDEFSLKDLSGGLYSNPSANRIPDNAATTLENFYTDVETAIERNGSEKRDTTTLGGIKPVTGLWEFVDNSAQQWIISFSSRTFYKNLVGNVPTAFGQLQSVGTVPDCAVNLGKIWCVDGTDSMWYFDGTSTASVAGAPIGTLIEPWRNRLIIGNIGGAQSTLRVSGDGDGTAWTIAGTATSPFSIQIGGANDGFNVTGMWKSYQDNFVISRKKDLWYLSGFSQDDWEMRNVSSEIGCIQQGSMREFDGSFLFLSARGMEELRGYTITNISEPIRDITDVIVKNTASVRSSVYTSQADWETGTSTFTGQLSTTLLSGSLSNKTTNFYLTTTADWNTGTFDSTLYVDTNTTSGTIQTTFPDTFDSFKNGTGGTKLLWSTGTTSDGAALVAYTVTANGKLTSSAQYTATGFDTYLRATDPTFTLGTGVTFYFQLADLTVSDQVSCSAGQRENYLYLVLSTANVQTFGTVGNYWYTQFYSTTSGKVQILNIVNNTDSLSFASQAFPMPSTVTFYVDSSKYQYAINGVVVKQGSHTWPALSVIPQFHLRSQSSCDSNTAGFSLDNFSVFPATPTWTSTVYDTTASSPTWGVFNANISTPSITFKTLVSDAGVSFDTGVSVTTGSTITSLTKRYIKTTALFGQVQAATSPVSSLNDLSFGGGSSATYTSGSIFLSSAILSFGPVSILDTKADGNTIIYQFNTSTSPIMAASSWTTIVNGGVPTLDIHNWVAFRATINLSSVTSPVSIQQFTITWNEGTTPPIVSWNYDRRYWLSYTTSTAASPYNDRILVYQRNRTWTLLTGLNAASFATWRDFLYFGNSSSTGYVYKFDTGNNDDGSSIVSRITTKSYDLGAFKSNKDLESVYVNFLGNSAFSGSFSLTYSLDRAGTDYSLGSANLSEGTGEVAAKFPFSLSNPVQGREIQYKIVKSGTGDRLKLYELSTVFTLMEAQ